MTQQQPAAQTAGQPIAVRVAAVSPVATAEAAPAPAESQPTQQEELVETAADPLLSEDDDIFGGDDVFDAKGTKEAAAALDDDEEIDVNDALEGLDGDGDTVSDGSDSDNEPEALGAFTIHNRNCLRCIHLIPDLESDKFIKSRAFTKCHYSEGNEDCPAKSVVVVIGIPVQKIAESYLEAEEEGDNARMARIMAKLSGVDEHQRKMANQAIVELRKKKLLTASA